MDRKGASSIKVMETAHLSVKRVTGSRRCLSFQLRSSAAASSFFTFCLLLAGNRLFSIRNWSPLAGEMSENRTAASLHPRPERQVSVPWRSIIHIFRRGGGGMSLRRRERVPCVRSHAPNEILHFCNFLKKFEQNVPQVPPVGLVTLIIEN
jgi:hypothetical protein